MLCCVPSCEVCDLVLLEVSKHRILNSVQFWCHARRSSVIAKVDRAVSFYVVTLTDQLLLICHGLASSALFSMHHALYADSLLMLCTCTCMSFGTEQVRIRC
jgi:hypothetical protein